MSCQYTTPEKLDHTILMVRPQSRNQKPSRALGLDRSSQTTPESSYCINPKLHAKRDRKKQTKKGAEQRNVAIRLIRPFNPQAQTRKPKRHERLGSPGSLIRQTRNP